MLQKIKFVIILLPDDWTINMLYVKLVREMEKMHDMHDNFKKTDQVLAPAKIHFVHINRKTTE